METKPGSVFSPYSAITNEQQNIYFSLRQAIFYQLKMKPNNIYMGTDKYLNTRIIGTEWVEGK